jgi:hypothetical protein
MKKFTITTLVILSLGTITLAWLSETGRLKRFLVLNSTPTPTIVEKKNSYLKKLQSKAAEATLFVQKNNFNDKICFLIDMSVGSNESRFFVYDLKKDTIRNAGLVTHGRCNEYWLEGRKYGNTVGCGCTSLGKYKIGYSYNGKFGLAFKLHGLDKTNDKAYARFVVLHGHECVPETEVEEDICQSDGCPTVAPGFLQQLKPIIKASDKPVLLWIFE